MVTPEDERLIEACLNGHAAAQKRLYDRYCKKMMAVCYRYIGNRDEAEDVFHDAFVKVFDKLGTFRKEAALETWIMRIMIFTALNFLKAKKRIRFDSFDDEAPSIPSDTFTDHNINTDHLFAAIQSLPAGYRVVLNMFAIEGYSHAEIAEKLGITESTSRSQFVRAKALLAKKLEKLSLIPSHNHGNRPL